ncbi:hypothetical protein C0583_02485 [Candidatus Parcubacteria bacterium]|nr:MAG: hypothetical protein C0583_02485 [Candidatus Parcubacteria bacterium]
MIKKIYKKTKAWLDKYEKYLSPVAMGFGFVIDNLTLQRIDLWIENLVIITYLSIAVFSILYLNIYKKKKYKNRFLSLLNLILPFILQIVFGGLFSAFMVFYSRSATLFVSWPFLLILVSMLIGNELFRERYERLNFHLSILYLAFFAYSVFAVPVLVGRIDVDIWMASGGLSLLLIIVVILLLHRIDPEAIKKNKDYLLGSIIFIYALFNVLYFTNLIPPIPLSLKSAGVYHGINRSDSRYELFFEKPAWYEFWKETSSTYHWQKGERVYIFSAIFAPTRFKQKIYHKWQIYDEENNEWLERDRLGYSISGGRDGGYRGYTYKTNLELGKWRVDVITDDEKIIGRVKFEIIEKNSDLIFDQEINN